MKNTFSVVIVTFHSEEIIESTIKDLEGLDIVVIECSNNLKLKDKILSINKDINFIPSSDNLGYSAGNNLGIKNTKYDDILIINPDTILNNRNKKSLINYINTIDDYGILCPNLQSEECFSFSKKNNFLPTLVDWKSIGGGLISGCALLLNKSKLGEDVFFDENIFIYKEDTDMIKRANDKNINVYYLPNCSVTHKGTSSHNKKYNFEIEVSRQFHWPYGNVYFYIKHFGYLYAIKKWGRKFISSIFKTLIYFLIFNNKYKIYFSRFLGISSAFLKLKSWYRPKIKTDEIKQKNKNI